MTIPVETLEIPEQVEGTEARDAPLPGGDLPLTVIEPQSRWKFIDLGELWRYRELLFFLAWRDVKVRYKQTVLGAAWALLQPLATMVVFSVVLGRVAAAPNATVPYPLFVFTGLLPWLFFSGVLNAASNSIVGNQNLITKVYFPRLVIPLSSIGASSVDFLIAFGMLLVLMLGYGTLPSAGILLVPLLVLGLAVAALGLGIWLSALTVVYRDVRYVIPFLIQLWMFATPSIYVQGDPDLGRGMRLALLLNPAEGFIAAFRAAALGAPLDAPSLSSAVILSVTAFFLGCLYFRRVEHAFADVI